MKKALSILSVLSIIAACEPNAPRQTDSIQNSEDKKNEALPTPDFPQEILTQLQKLASEQAANCNDVPRVFQNYLLQESNLYAIDAIKECTQLALALTDAVDANQNGQYVTHYRMRPGIYTYKKKDSKKEPLVAAPILSPDEVEYQVNLENGGETLRVLLKKQQIAETTFQGTAENATLTIWYLEERPLQQLMPLIIGHVPKKTKSAIENVTSLRFLLNSSNINDSSRDHDWAQKLASESEAASILSLGRFILKSAILHPANSDAYLFYQRED